jgi:hypothetical protein
MLNKKIGTRGAGAALWYTIGVNEVKHRQSRPPVFWYDNVSSRKLLVDTGSTYSIFPFRSAAKPHGPRLKVANGQGIRYWGSRR